MRDELLGLSLAHTGVSCVLKMVGMGFFEINLLLGSINDRFRWVLEPLVI